MHSHLYTANSLTSLIHRSRLKKTLNLASKFFKSAETGEINFVDVGCSDGYVTHQINKLDARTMATGLEYEVDAVKQAARNYPNYNFASFDLCGETNIGKQFDLVTCLETLEHVNDLGIAVKNLISMTGPNGVLIISVPIEVGFIGFAKGLVKLFVLNYPLNEVALNKFEYLFFTLFLRQKISSKRIRKNMYSTHFGFDFYRVQKKLYDSGMVVEVQRTLGTIFFVCKHKICS
jgi:2-polyprenyl-3-methyl-5-hydroxy-6-metoxy-1,4-benzoquinol methylase